MGVDGIGGPRGPLSPPALGGPPTSGVQISGQQGRVGEARVGGPTASSAEAAASVEAQSVGAAAQATGADVERVRLARGEITLEQYLDHEVLRATSHLAPQAPPALLEVIQTALRQELATDPVLLALANRISAG